MTRDEQREVSKIVNENKRRLKRLKAEHDPVVGVGDGIVGERVRLKLDDYHYVMHGKIKPLPVQMIHVEMAEVPLIQELKKAGSVRNFINKHTWKKKPPTIGAVMEMIADLREQYDFQYWAYTQILINDKLLSGLIPFKLNYAQIKVEEEVERLRKANAPINIIICKARQWGGSTYSIFKQSWLALKWKPSHSFSLKLPNSAPSLMILLRGKIS